VKVDFFEPSTRTPSERSKICKDITPEMISDDYLKFGYDYFDNKEFCVGYHGYQYDGRYRKSAEKMVNHYGLDNGSKILELGCAKGFLLVEFHYLNMDVYGLDISEYAVNNSHPDIKDKIKLGRLTDMKFEDNSFDLIITKEYLPHLIMDELVQTLKETARISKQNIFHLIQCGSNKEELELMKKWDLTHKVLMTPEEWIDFFNKHNYKCDYQFKVLAIAEGM
jgi:protein-L-isoaspartate(D-aspartate) O-methyltransferase